PDYRRHAGVAGIPNQPASGQGSIAMSGLAHTDRLDTEKLEQFSLKVMTDIGNSLLLLLSYIGDQTGVYRALRDGGRMGAEALARAAGVDARYLREWLGAQAA